LAVQGAAAKAVAQASQRPPGQVEEQAQRQAGAAVEERRQPEEVEAAGSQVSVPRRRG